MRRVAVIGALASVLSCAHLGDRISYYEMAPRLAYQGFSFEKPPDSHWYIMRSEEHYTDVTLRRETASATHTFYASVALAALDVQPKSHKEFAKLVHSKGQTAPYAVTEFSHSETPTLLQNQWCVRFDTLAAVRGAPQAPDSELHMTVRGFRCLHPAFPKASIDFFYSERGLPSELDPGLTQEGEQFLRGVRIDVAPDTPAA